VDVDIVVVTSSAFLAPKAGVYIWLRVAKTAWCHWAFVRGTQGRQNFLLVVEVALKTIVNEPNWSVFRFGPT
jgi:hypothetical protein